MPARKKSRHEPAAAEQPVPQDACPTTVTLKTHNQNADVIPPAEAPQPQETARKTGKRQRSEDTKEQKRAAREGEAEGEASDGDREDREEGERQSTTEQSTTKGDTSSHAPSQPLAPAAPPPLAPAAPQPNAVREHCLFKRDDIAKAYTEQLKQKYGALPEFETWLEHFIAALWENLNENVKIDCPKQKDFEKQVIDARGAASQFCKKIVFDDVADESVVEKVYRQLQPPKTLWEIWKEKSAPLFEGTERTKVIAFGDDLSQARTRHVSCTLLDTRDIAAVAQLIRDPADRVVFVHGESGSGKTVCATCAANCLNDHVVAFYIRCDAPEANWGKSERNARARAYVKAKAAEALGRHPGVTCTTTTRVIIILDEMGQHPQLARGICAARAAIADEIRAYLMLEGKPVNLVCVGTGVEGTDMAPGSEPAYYVLHRIATTTNLWQRWAQEDPQCAELRKVMAESGAWSMLATAMVENARAAALFMDHVSHHLHLCTTRSSCLAYLQSAVLETAFAYKKKNGATSIVSTSTILEALQYPFHRLTSLADEDLHFARQYGVLTDLATFEIYSPSHKNFKPMKFIVDEAVKYLAKLGGKDFKTEYVDKPAGMVLSIPAKAWSRYEMSAAQLALCRIGYGVSPRAPTCDGFEGTVVDFVLFALLAGPPPPQSRLLHDDADRHPAFVLLDQLYEGESVRPAHVTVYQLHVTLDKQHAAKSGSKHACQGGCGSVSDADCQLDDVLGVVKKDLCDNHAVILLNAPKASYADAMVLLPRGRLLLLQCKYYTATKLTDTNAQVEFDKMGLEDPTTQLLQSLFSEKSPCQVVRMIVVYGPQDTPAVDRNTGRYSPGCYVVHLRPDVISKASSDVGEGEEQEEERVEDATARAFKNSTARLLYPVQMSVNVEAAMKKFDRDSFDTPPTKTQQAI